MLKKFILLLLCVFAVCGCASSKISKSIVFNESSEKGLAIVGTYGVEFTVLFSKFDPQTKQIEAGPFHGNRSLSHSGGLATEYNLIDMDPGIYVIRSVSYSSPGRVEVNCLSGGTYMFEIQAGTVLYLGDVLSNLYSKATVSKGDLLKAQHAMKAYPHVTNKVFAANLTPTKFINGTTVLGTGGACGGVYYK